MPEDISLQEKIGHRSNMAYDADSDTYTCAIFRNGKKRMIGSVDMNGP